MVEGERAVCAATVMTGGEGDPDQVAQPPEVVDGRVRPFRLEGPAHELQPISNSFNGRSCGAAPCP